ncbi:putative late blight resistance protein homolog R1A-4 [Nicotiana tabacum]|uniref:Late blight resistance protein homolog R1A-4 n=1 Tax=Nicotiana tabacum TaxID=4097 RepID=A0A1S3Z806_TOBAC|nr:PREDICTED: putative late blight resistance protein homolog R1A-4 [Nicotiana tabacum]
MSKNLIYGNIDDYESSKESRLLENLVHLHQLETLSLCVESWHYSTVTIPSAKAFPPMLKKLKLLRTGLMWEDLNIIGELPTLEVLKLMLSACRGEEWQPTEGGFTRLKLLLIEGNHLKYWKAPADNFPVLERLVIRDCTELDEIPIEFADILSLQLIELQGCKLELEAFAARIQHEQEDIGNKPVDVRTSNTYLRYAFGYESYELDDCPY